MKQAIYYKDIIMSDRDRAFFAEDSATVVSLTRALTEARDALLALKSQPNTPVNWQWIEAQAMKAENVLRSVRVSAQDES
jgi:hypothetical protein